MQRLLVSMVVFVGALGAQSFDFFQVPGTQVYEYRGGALVGGTYLGVNLAEIDADRARELNLKETYGVEITRVEDGSPAEKAGLKPNDVVLEYNGQRVEGMEQFGRLVRETPAGRDAKLVISRNGATQTVTATLATRKIKALAGNMKELFGPDMPEIHIPDIPQVFTTWRSPMMGVEAETLGSQLAAYFGVKDGVLVRSVVKDSAAEKAGIKAGDVITKVDGSKVTTPNELSSAVRSASSKKPFSVELVRDHKDLTVSVTIEDGRSERMIPRTRAVRSAQ
jgi:serine protease Do